MPEVTKTFTFDSPRAGTWDFFNSPEKVAACVPGCEAVEQIDEDTFDALIGVSVAYTNLTFDATIEIVDRDPMTSMDVEGSAEPTGRMPGAAHVSGHLQMEGDGVTEGEVTIEFGIRGRLGSLGESAFTRKCEEMTQEFLDNVEAELAGVEV